MASKPPSRVPRRLAGTWKRPPKKMLDIDEKDFLDMIMAEVNEDEAAEVLGGPEQNLWSKPEDEGEDSKPE